jgi:hypothetical protein
MSEDSEATEARSRLLYPTVPKRPTEAQLRRLFTPSRDDKTWAHGVARTASSQVALLTLLMVFRVAGRFEPLRSLPKSVPRHIAKCLAVDGEWEAQAVDSSESTQYRHRQTARERLEIKPWGSDARQLTRTTLLAMARVRTDPADLINAAVDALVRHRFELPSLAALQRKAYAIHKRVSGAQWRRVSAQLTSDERVTA